MTGEKTVEYQPVTLQLKSGPLTVEGQVFGSLAVTPYLYPPLYKGFMPDRWNITHIRSGQTIVEKLKDQPKALLLAGTLNKKFKWSTVDEDGLGMSEDERQRVRKFLERSDT